jgi:hypothetical protein
LDFYYSRLASCNRYSRKRSWILRFDTSKENSVKQRLLEYIINMHF